VPAEARKGRRISGEKKNNKNGGKSEVGGEGEYLAAHPAVTEEIGEKVKVLQMQSVQNVGGWGGKRPYFNWTGGKKKPGKESGTPTVREGSKETRAVE